MTQLAQGSAWKIGDAFILQVKDTDENGYHGKHGLRAKLKPSLNEPECIYPCRLRDDTHYQKIGQLKGVIRHDGILKGGYDRDSCVQAIAQEKVADQVEQTLPELPDLSDSVIQLP